MDFIFKSNMVSLLTLVILAQLLSYIIVDTYGMGLYMQKSEKFIIPSGNGPGGNKTSISYVFPIICFDKNFDSRH